MNADALQGGDCCDGSLGLSHDCPAYADSLGKKQSESRLANDSHGGGRNNEEFENNRSQLRMACTGLRTREDAQEYLMGTLIIRG